MFGKHADQDSRIEMLARLDRFQDLSDDEIGLVVQKATYLTVPEHWALMVEQTPADKAYLILDGEVSVRRHGEEVARLGAGELIGEMALVNHKLRSATVVAETALEVLHFTDETVSELADAIPNFREALAGAADERRG
ncbi:MAG TPA: cyclic nucleotide-binding domain-containing protein [Marmoricola sp.]|jgi:CRP-like cAMP-binding protein|nr:cyclic nucleotide-binding domain-containing protein [Marmoricola sp.]